MTIKVMKKENDEIHLEFLKTDGDYTLFMDTYNDIHKYLVPPA